MLTWRSWAVVGAMVLGCVALGRGEPVDVEADAPVSGYPGLVTVRDPVEGVFQSPSWDIQAVEFWALRAGLLIHVYTVEPLDRNGGDTSITGTTRFVALLTDAATSETHMIELAMTETTEELHLDGVRIEHGQWDFEDWQAWAGRDDGDLRIWIGSYLVPPFVYAPWEQPYERRFEFQALLDDTDVGPDDRIVGWVPEPGALTLLALAAAALLRRRGRPARR
jgi:MYXO-CTERM domain-containing protein